MAAELVGVADAGVAAVGFGGAEGGAVQGVAAVALA